MEHRSGIRRDVCMNITLSRRGKNMGNYQTHNIGSGGVAITGQVLNTFARNFVTVRMPVAEGDIEKYIDLEAFVIHQSDESTGLMWAEFDHLRIGIAKTQPVFAFRA